MGRDGEAPAAAIDSAAVVCGNSGASYCEAWILAARVDGGLAYSGDIQLNCDGQESYVDIIGDGDPIRLVYPMDSSCGTCGSAGCQIWGRYSVCCASCDVRFAACAGSDGAGPCLDFHDCGRYFDRTGKSWLAAMMPESLNSNGPLDLQASVTITDGTTTRSLSVHVHICGTADTCGIVC